MQMKKGSHTVAKNLHYLSLFLDNPGNQQSVNIKRHKPRSVTLINEEK